MIGTGSKGVRRRRQVGPGARILARGSFRWKVTAALIASTVTVVALSNAFIYSYALDAQFDQLRDKLKVVAQTAALFIDGDRLEEIPLTREGVESPAYQATLQKLKRILDANPPVRFVYIMTRTEEQGIWQFVVDPDAEGGGQDVRRGQECYPGARYDASRFPEMMKAFDGPTADTRLGSDEWGSLLSGYAPIRNQHGEPVAVLGVDVTADDVYAVRRLVHRRGIAVLGAGIAIAVGLGIALSGWITRRIEDLAEGTRRISKGEFTFRVDDSGHDEVAGLASDFNRMARALWLSRKKTHHYFYRAMQSMIRILEAKDIYTRGHSDRVAGYAAGIAKTMGLDEHAVELIWEAAQLHDIGKLAIQDSVLNKKETLTPEEWDLIHQHPAIGEDILRSAVFDKELLAIVRGHHEHYDGTGYPDQLAGEGINLYAQILAVADAYDAMTTDRAYRAALSRETAIEEIRRNRGQQFHPRVVDEFLKYLRSGMAGQGQERKELGDVADA